MNAMEAFALRLAEKLVRAEDEARLRRGDMEEACREIDRAEDERADTERFLGQMREARDAALSAHRLSAQRADSAELALAVHQRTLRTRDADLARARKAHQGAADAAMDFLSERQDIAGRLVTAEAKVEKLQRDNEGVYKYARSLEGQLGIGE